MQNITNTELPEYYKDNKTLEYIYDYSKDLSEDRVLQNILVLSENLYNIQNNNCNKETVLYCIDFLSEKINKIIDITNMFNFTIRTDRLTTVARILDFFTTEEYYINYNKDAELKLSLILDLLSTALNMFTLYYKYEFESKN